jgi:hypothetical protein
MIRDEKSNRPDEELACLAADGDAAAFDEIYSRHRRFVYSLAVRMTGNQADVWKQVVGTEEQLSKTIGDEQSVHAA